GFRWRTAAGDALAARGLSRCRAAGQRRDGRDADCVAASSAGTTRFAARPAAAALVGRTADGDAARDPALFDRGAAPVLEELRGIAVFRNTQTTLLTRQFFRLWCMIPARRNWGSGSAGFSDGLLPGVVTIP